MQNRTPSNTAGRTATKLDSKHHPKEKIKHHHLVSAISVNPKSNENEKKETTVKRQTQLLLNMSIYYPKHYVILAGGILQKWSIWALIPEITTDADLAKRLSGITKDVIREEAEKKEISQEEVIAHLLSDTFKDIAKGWEKNYIDQLERYFQEAKLENNHFLEKCPAQNDEDQSKKYLLKKRIVSHKGESKEISVLPVTILGWENRHSLEIYDKEISTPLPEQKVFNSNLAETKEQLLKNKKELLETTKSRLIKANSVLADFDFDKIIYECIKNYQVEEYRYFEHLKGTEVLYPNIAPPLLQPLFNVRPDRLWRSYSHRDTQPKKEQPRKERSASTKMTHESGVRDKAPPPIQTIILEEPTSRSTTSLYLRRVHSTSAIEHKKHGVKLFEPLTPAIENKYKPQPEQKNVVEINLFQRKAPLSPKTEKLLTAFFTLFESSSSANKELALKEATAILSKG